MKQRKSQGSSVSMTTGYMVYNQDLEVQFLVELGVFLFSTASRPALGLIQPAVQWVPGGKVAGA